MDAAAAVCDVAHVVILQIFRMPNDTAVGGRLRDETLELLQNYIQ